MTLLRGSRGSAASAWGKVRARSRRNLSNSEYLETQLDRCCLVRVWVSVPLSDFHGTSLRVINAYSRPHSSCSRTFNSHLKFLLYNSRLHMRRFQVLNRLPRYNRQSLLPLPIMLCFVRTALQCDLPTRFQKDANVARLYSVLIHYDNASANKEERLHGSRSAENLVAF